MIIQAENIHKSFGALEVLKGVDLQVHKGEILSIGGASGAGKSTVLQILGTLSSADSGNLYIDGCDVSGLSRDALADFRCQHIGFVFQSHHLLPEFSAEENVMIPAMIAGVSSREARRNAREWLARLGLAERFQHKPSELSGGEPQLGAIARSVMSNPSVLLADEPTGSLDSSTKQDIQNVLFDLRKSTGQTIVLVTHDPELASSCDRCLKMKDGRFV